MSFKDKKAISKEETIKLFTKIYIEEYNSSKIGKTNSMDFLLISVKPYVVGVIRKFINETFDIDDCLQETFIKFYSNYKSICDKTKLFSYLGAIASNVAKSHYIKIHKNRNISLDDPDTQIEEGVFLNCSQEDEYFRGELSKAILDGIASLKDDYKNIIILRYVEGMRHEDIANLLDMPAGTVRTYDCRAKKKLMKYLTNTIFKEQVYYV